MGLTATLVRLAAARPRVFLASIPGATPVRLAAERELRRRGWPLAATAAQADILLVTGAIEGLNAAVREAWVGISAPRAFAGVEAADEIATVLDHAQQALSDTHVQPTGPVHTADSEHPIEPEQPSMRGMAIEMHEMPGMHSTDDMDMGGDSAMDMDVSSDMAMDMGSGTTMSMDGDGSTDMDMGMDMNMPGGLSVARQGPDRDGLELDRLHLTLGPLLSDWPTGLVVRVVMQGDVLQQVETEIAGTGLPSGSWWNEPWRQAAAGDVVAVSVAARRRLAAHLDSLGRFLAVAGWVDAASTARRLRDDTLTGAPAGVISRPLTRFAGKVSRSPVLRWSTRGMGRLPGDAPPHLSGDVSDRYQRWLSGTIECLERLDDPTMLNPEAFEPARGHWDPEHPPSAAMVTVVPEVLRGVELAAARLVIASLDPDLDELAPAFRHG
jgi:hypothetical protein